MFYAGGIAEHAIGRRPPGTCWRSCCSASPFAPCTWKAAACLSAAACTSSCATAWAAMPRLSVSALVFDYILTGPISVVSAGQYLGHLLNEIGEMATSSDAHSIPNLFAAVFGVIVTRVLLVEQYQGHPRIQRQGAAHHADHHRHGGRVPDLVPAHDFAPRHMQVPPARFRAICSSATTRSGWFSGTVWPQIPARSP